MRTQSLMRKRHLCDLCTYSDIIVLIVHAYIRMYFFICTYITVYIPIQQSVVETNH